MITDADIAFMREASSEIKRGRRREVTVSYKTGVYDDISGELTDEITVERNVLSVVTEISGERGGNDRYVGNGIDYEKGDIQLAIEIELIADIAEEITYVSHDGITYVILSIDKKGIGERNRYELIARRTV